jgi:hypothetical protein
MTFTIPLPLQREQEALVEHARTEEEVTYPAAVLVGQVVRQRLGRRASAAA